MSRSTARPARALSRTLLWLVSCLVGLVAFGAEARAEDPATDFKQICSSCHTIGGGVLTGPDLREVSKRQKRDWLVNFIVDPGAVLDSGDPYAADLLAVAGQRMPNIPGMTRSRAEGLLDLIEAESVHEPGKSRFAGMQISDRPFTDRDVAAGRAIFTGETSLVAGGTACISCHTVGGLGGLGGGRLGPDLTRVFERYEDRRKLGVWLSAPATETMLPTFREHPLEQEEILSLLAYFENAMQKEQEDDAPRALVLVLLGVGGAIGALLLFNRAWRDRFTGVRRCLVRSAALSESARTPTPDASGRV